MFNFLHYPVLVVKAGSFFFFTGHEVIFSVFGLWSG